jgi:hypothetical protein
LGRYIGMGSLLQGLVHVEISLKDPLTCRQIAVGASKSEHELASRLVGASVDNKAVVHICLKFQSFQSLLYARRIPDRPNSPVRPPSVFQARCHRRASRLLRYK